MDFIKNAKHIHCIGIGGIGVSALAQLWRAQGKEVSGSDAQASEVTKAFRAQGIQVHIGQISNFQFPISNGVELIVYSDAVPENHPERVAARAAGIPELSYAQALGEVSRQYRTVVVTGTHGKSTTTAMLGLMLEAAGMDPLVIVGTRVSEWGNRNLRLPKSTSYVLPTTYLVVEGDDYRDHFLELAPYAVVVINIEYDHPDYFRDLDHTVESFRKLMEKVSDHGFVVANQDDAGCRSLATQKSHTNKLEFVGMKLYGRDSEVFKNLHLQVPGEFNRYNATAAAVCAMELGAPQEVVEKVAREFRGVWRRFEVVGTLNLSSRAKRSEVEGSLADASNRADKLRDSSPSAQNDDIVVVSDYAHHPTAIRATMKAAREAYPGRRLVLVFQPHQHSRTKRLFNEFADALKDVADLTIVSEIYTVKGRMEDRDVSSRDLVTEISRLRNREINNVVYGGNLVETKRMVLEHVKAGDVVIFMGAGDIDMLAKELVAGENLRS